MQTYHRKGGQNQVDLTQGGQNHVNVELSQGGQNQLVVQLLQEWHIGRYRTIIGGAKLGK